MNKKIKLTLIFIFTLFFILLIKSNCFAVSVINEEIPSAVWDSFNNYISEGPYGYYDSNYTWAESLSFAKNFIVMSGAYNHYLFMFFEDGYFNTSSNKFIYNNVNCPSGSYNYFWIEFNPDGSYAGHSGGGRSGYYYFSNDGVANIWYPNLIYSTFDLYDQNNNLILSGSGGTIGEVIFINPSISNTAEDLARSNYDTVLINPGSFEITDSFTFVVRKVVPVDTGEITYNRQEVIFSCTLNSSSPYYHSVDDEFWYEIPRSSINSNFQNGEKFIYSLEQDGEVLQDISVTVGGLTEEDIEANRFTTIKDAIVSSNEKVEDAIKEQTQVTRNIFQSIGNILSYINPLSENFFGKKLVELILDGIKSLFIPDNDFFSDYFSEIQNWFSDRLGFLWTPFDIIINILNRILNINFGEPRFDIPDINEPFTNTKLISATSFNFNDLLNNNVFKTVHDIYLIIVDAFIIFALINLTKAKIEGVFKN